MGFKVTAPPLVPSERDCEISQGCQLPHIPLSLYHRVFTSCQCVRWKGVQCSLVENPWLACGQFLWVLLVVPVRQELPLWESMASGKLWGCAAESSWNTVWLSLTSLKWAAVGILQSIYTHTICTSLCFKYKFVSLVVMLFLLNNSFPNWYLAQSTCEVLDSPKCLWELWRQITDFIENTVHNLVSILK